MGERALRAVAAAILTLGVLLVFWPALRLPFVLDVIRYLHELELSGGEPFFARLWGLLPFFLHPSNFRPLGAPAYLVLHGLFGAEPFAFRLVILLFHGIASACVFGAARIALRGERAGLFAAVFYALSWTHWETVMFVNLPQSMAHAAAWGGVWTYLRMLRDGRSLRGAVWLLLICSGGLLLKEDVIVVPLLAAAAAWAGELRVPWKTHLSAFGLWTAAYVVGRLVLPQPFTDPAGIYAFSLPGALDPRSYARAATVLLEPLTAGFAGPPLRLLTLPLAWLAWLFALLAAGVALGWVVHRAGKDGGPAIGVSRTVRFGAIGVLAATAPYACFDGVSAHRLALAAGVFSIALGGMAAAGIRSLERSRPRNDRLGCAAGCAALMVWTGLVFLQPDSRLWSFRHSGLAADTRGSVRCVKEALRDVPPDGRALRFEGVEPYYRIARLLELEGWGRIVSSGPACELRLEKRAGSAVLTMEGGPCGAGSVCAWPERLDLMGGPGGGDP